MPRDDMIRSVEVDQGGATRATVLNDQRVVIITTTGPIFGVSLQVHSDRADYRFTLSSVFRDGAPMILRVIRAEQRQSEARPAPDAGPHVSYRLTGDKAVRPAQVFDDGAKTYVAWSSAQAIPAVFALDELGQEQMVNGYMRDGSFVIDRVYDRLVFRIDKAEAQALRMVDGGKPR
jgi:type IV secretion system protein VirB9